MALSGIIGGIEIERDRNRRLAIMLLPESFDARGDVEVDQLLEHGTCGKCAEMLHRIYLESTGSVNCRS
jgi:hypothetical protein